MIALIITCIALMIYCAIAERRIKLISARYSALVRKCEKEGVVIDVE